VAETSNISKIAEILANDLFSRFLWYESGGWNQNWACVRDDHVTPKKKKKKQNDPPKGDGGFQTRRTEGNPHGTDDNEAQVQKVLTHPSDVVFYYDEPYSLTRTYINTDLKSYKKGSITARVIAAAVQNLALTLECAEVSDEWREKFVHEKKPFRIVGLLFIYNHDGEYDAGFDDLLANVNHGTLRIPTNSRIVVLGPRDIRWLDNVRYDIVSLRGMERLPHEDHCSYVYPDLVRKKKLQLSARAATLEMLTGPWIILSYRKETIDPAGYVIYFRGLGKHTEEFLYLLDHLQHYQMVKPGLRISVRAFDADPNAPALFKRAVDEYIENYEGDYSELAALLRSIEYEIIPQVKSQFSLVKIGMTRG
jgi:hypothetical protein